MCIRDRPGRGQSLGEVLEGLVEREHLTPRERRALHWHMANLEYGCAASLQRVSLAWWDQDDAQEMLGDHLVLKDGFDTLIDGLAAYSEVLTEREVTLVEHGDEGVRVHTRGGGESIVADAALVTVPLGVLTVSYTHLTLPTILRV